jgi:hypothetical protein
MDSRAPLSVGIGDIVSVHTRKHERVRTAGLSPDPEGNIKD